MRRRNESLDKVNEIIIRNSIGREMENRKLATRLRWVKICKWEARLKFYKKKFRFWNLSVWGTEKRKMGRV